jgi:hypothetical protein
MIFHEPLWNIQFGREAAGSTVVGSPRGVSLAGASESLLDRTGSLGSFGASCFSRPRQGRDKWERASQLVH